MTSPWWRSVGIFLLSSGVAIALLLAVSVYGSERASALSQAMSQVATNALPSLEELMSARGELRLLLAQAEEYLTSPNGSPGLASTLQDTHSRCRTHFSRYLGLPFFQEERAELPATVEAFDQALAIARRCLTAREEPPVVRQELLERLRQSIARADQRLGVMQQLNHAHVVALSKDLEEERGSLRRQILLFNGISLLIAALAVALSVRSASRQRALERAQALQLQTRAAELESFASRVAHDLLSPLTASGLALDKLSGCADPEVATTAQRGKRGVARVRSTVDGLLEFARAGARPAAGVHCDLGLVAAEVVQGFAHEAEAARATITLADGCGGAEVPMTPGVALSVLSNLVQNAIKYLGDAPTRRVEVRVAKRDGRVLAEVSDTGPGVPAGQEQHIFEPYFRGRAPTSAGLGLGLATVKRLVEVHGGSVGVRSRPGEGATFWVDLPAAG